MLSHSRVGHSWRDPVRNVKGTGFGAEGFAIGQKDRLNVQCIVRPKPGSTGRVVAVATRIDNRTNDPKNLVLRP